jgi:serine protease Do
MLFVTLTGVASAATQTTVSLADLAAKVAPAVVSITSLQRGAPASVDKALDHSSNLQKSKDAKYSVLFGSGFIIDPQGYIVTNSHVIGNAGEIRITLSGGRDFSAEVIGADKSTDLALLKIDASSPLPYVSFGNSDATQVGDPILAVGNPFGLGGTVTTGIVSALGRDLHTGPFDDFLQIDASINPGSSGGPTFNLMGEVVGINTAIASPNGGSVGIGFAIPANLAKPIVQELRLHGRVVRGWIGVAAQEVTPEIAESLDLGEPSGALIVSIRPGSPAAAANLKQGDVIMSFDENRVSDARELPRIVAGEPAGKRVDVVVWRGDSRKTVNLTIGSTRDKSQVALGDDRAGSLNDNPGHLLSGVQLTSITDGLRRKLAIPDDADGVVVLELAEGSLAAREGLRQGDIIEQVERSYVSSPAEVDRLVRLAAAKGRSAVLILVNRGGNEFYLPIKAAKGEYLGDPLLQRPAARCA